MCDDLIATYLASTPTDRIEGLKARCDANSYYGDYDTTMCPECEEEEMELARQRDRERRHRAGERY
jgi:hypothetical protein